GQEGVAKWRAASNTRTTTTAPDPTASIHRPRREPRERASAPTRTRYLRSNANGAVETAITAARSFSRLSLAAPRVQLLLRGPTHFGSARRGDEFRAERLESRSEEHTSELQSR